MTARTARELRFKLHRACLPITGYAVCQAWRVWYPRSTAEYDRWHTVVAAERQRELAERDAEERTARRLARDYDTDFG